MRKIELFSGLLLAVLVMSGMALVVRGWLAPAGHPPALAAPTTVQTAKTAYDLARPVAQNWSPDAQLVTAQANWPAGSTFSADEANWGFVFYAPGRNETALVSVVSGRAQLLRVRPANTPPTTTADPAGWQTDSQTIITRILSEGGQQFIQQQQSQVALSLTLLANEQYPIWQAQLTNPKTQAIWVVRLSAINGELLETQPNQ